MIETFATLYFPLIILISISSGVLGSFVLWRKLSYMSDSLSHFSILGAAISFIFCFNLNLMIFAFALIYIILLFLLKNRFHSETLVAIFANSGLVLALILSSIFNKVKIDFMSLLFGDILVTNKADLLVFAILTAMILIFTMINWRAIIMTILNVDYAKSKAVNTDIIDLFLFISLAAYVVIAIKIIGAILLSSMLILPAASASMIANNPKKMVIFSIIISFICQCAGMICSYFYDLSCGASIALCGFIVFFLLSLFRFKKI